MTERTLVEILDHVEDQDSPTYIRPSELLHMARALRAALVWLDKQKETNMSHTFDRLEREAFRAACREGSEALGGGNGEES